MTSFWSFTKKYMIPFLPWYLVGVVCVFGTQAIMVSIIEETKTALDTELSLLEVQQVPDESGGVPLRVSAQQKKVIHPFVLRILTLAGLLLIIRILSRYFIFTPGRIIEFKIRNNYFHTLLNKPRSFFSDFETGDLISRASNDIGYIRAAYGYGILQIVNVISTFSIGIWAMWRMDPLTTFMIGIPMFLTLAVIQISIYFLLNHWKRANEELGTLSSFCLASFRGISAVKGYHAEPRFNDIFRQYSFNYLKTNLLIAAVRSYVMPLVQFSGNIATFIVLWVIGRQIINGQNTIGEISAYMGYIAMVMPPLLSLGWMMNVFTRALPATDRLHAILKDNPGVSGSPEPCQGTPSLTVRGLNLRFAENQFKLRNIDLSLPPGKKLGIVGEVGSGKTVLIETLLQLNTPESGQILLNGQAANEMDLRAYRANFSFAPQRAFLFSASLRDNLQVARHHLESDLCEEDIHQALVTAGFQLDPMQFPDGLDTQVGEKGILLSGGQRQRIALARCLLKKAAIFVLDDVLSAVDQETQKNILDNLEKLGGEKSFIIVSHRISAVQFCDEIIVLRDGEIADRGTHRELMRRSGYYRKSCLYQKGGASQGSEGKTK
ncbi:MAG: hypothetical protein CSA81_12375 [Acidobacteria bacterium]|nr:MAG: hypothetical protein CSA81_12375 [Acidobacteriota bacterium]